jgi:hypothetical protein
MRAANEWVNNFLPNAQTLPQPESDRAPKGFGRVVQHVAEWPLSGQFGNWLEDWERARKLTKFEKQLHQRDSAAVLDERQVKGHFDDYGGKALAAFETRCLQHDITPGPIA